MSGEIICIWKFLSSLVLYLECTADWGGKGPESKNELLFPKGSNWEERVNTWIKEQVKRTRKNAVSECGKDEKYHTLSNCVFFRRNLVPQEWSSNVLLGRLEDAQYRASLQEWQTQADGFNIIHTRHWDFKETTKVHTVDSNHHHQHAWPYDLAKYKNYFMQQSHLWNWKSKEAWWGDGSSRKSNKTKPLQATPIKVILKLFSLSVMFIPKVWGIFVQISNFPGWMDISLVGVSHWKVKQLKRQLTKYNM